jgi:hypothetical protein
MALEDFNGFKFNGPKIGDLDLPRIGRAIGVGEDIVHGIMDVEAAGSGTDRAGRLKALYEPHVAYRNSAGSVRAALVKAGLAYPKWKRNYPADSYPRIFECAEIAGAEIALRSTSWGLPQILGENFSAAGYDSATAMVQDFLRDEDNQLEAMLRFIETNDLDDELQALEAKLAAGKRVTADECRAFVRGYNGAGYAKNGYHTKFAASLNKWAKIKDTPFDPAKDLEIVEERADDLKEAATGEGNAPSATPPTEVPPAATKVDKDLYDGRFHTEVQNVQARLDALGYPEVGAVDGRWGSKTRAAILAFRADNGLPLDTVIDDKLLAALLRAEPRTVGMERATTTVQDLRDKGAEDVKAADGVTTVGGLAGLAGALGAVQALSEMLDNYATALQPVTDFLEPMVAGLGLDGKVWTALLGLGGAAVYFAYRIKQIRVDKHRTARDVSE